MSVDQKRTDPPGVLYVEDDDLTRERISARLERKGFRVIAAPSGEAALDEHCRCAELEVALLDLELPGISGVETWRQLRERNPAIAGVICSGALTDTTRGELQELGIRSDCCLCKPCRFQELLQALRRATGTRTAPQ